MRKPRATRDKKRKRKPEILSPGRNGEDAGVSFEQLKSLSTRRVAREAYGQLRRFNHRAVATLTRLADEKAEAFVQARRELKETQTRYADLYELAPVGFVTLDGLGRIEEINMTAATILERSRRVLIRTPFTLYVVRDDLNRFMTHLLRCKQRKQRVESELRLKSRGGEPIPTLLSTTPVSTFIKDGVVLYQTAIVDLTERKRAEEALRESNERLRAIVDQATAGMARADLNGQLLFVNQRLCKMLGYTESELLGKKIRDFTHPLDAAKTGKLFRLLAAEGKPYEMEKRYLRKNGSIIWVSVSASPVRDADGKPHSAVGVMVDITSRKKAEAALKGSRQMLEKLVHQRTRALRAANAELEEEIRRRKGLEGEILAVSDREQQRIGQELHDSLCQQLSAIGMMTRAAGLRLRNHRVVQVEDLEKIAQLINNSVIDARNIARDLHKEEVDAAGFARALRDLVDRKIWITPCRLSLKAKTDIEDDTVASELYRILREALMNANKHARATKIVLEVSQNNEGLIFRVTDNGVGLRAKPQTARGLGFHIMKYRAKAIGARLEMESPKTGGTRVAVYLPQKK